MLACWHAGTFACCYVGISSRFPTAVGLAVRNNRHEHRRFFFSHVHNPFQQCLADFRRPERFDTESEGGYRFEVVNLRAVFVRYDVVDFFSDLKIRKLIKYQGGKAVTVYALLLCIIYKQGYYMRWDKELPFIISEQTGYEEVYIQEVIKSCLVIGLFSNELFEKEKIITSKGIQERYQYICNLSKRKCVISEFILISSETRQITFLNTYSYSR